MVWEEGEQALGEKPNGERKKWGEDGTKLWKGRRWREKNEVGSKHKEERKKTWRKEEERNRYTYKTGNGAGSGRDYRVQDSEEEAGGAGMMDLWE